MSNFCDAVVAKLDTVVPKHQQGLQRALVVVDGSPCVIYVSTNGCFFPTKSDYNDQQVGTSSSAALATTSTTNILVEKDASNAIGAGDGEQGDSYAPSNLLEEELSSEEQSIKQAFDKQNLLRKEQEAAYQEFIDLKKSFGERHPTTLAKWKESVDLGDEWYKVIGQLGELTSKQENNDFNALVRKWYPEVEKFKNKDFWTCFSQCNDRFEQNKSFYERSLVPKKPKNTKSAKASSASNAQGTPVLQQGQYLLALLKAPKEQPKVDADTPKPQPLERGRWRKAVASYSVA